jgi:hypothetical protein
MAKAIVLLFITLMLAGCYQLGEPQSGVYGRIVSETGAPIQGCTMAKRHPDDHGDMEFAKEVVNSEFSYSWLRGLSGSRFQIVVRCPGYTNPYVSKIFREDDIPEATGVLDLGTIKMKHGPG